MAGHNLPILLASELIRKREPFHNFALRNITLTSRAKVQGASLPSPADERPTASVRDACLEWVLREESTPSATVERLRTT